MKRFSFLLPVALLVLFYSCESFTEEEVILLPTNMTATLVQGSQTSKVIADFHYIEGTELLDHITWSNHQTHYFEYDEMSRISVMRALLVKPKVQEERRFSYEGELVDRITLVKRNLDYVFLEPLDSIYVGYIEFAYNGKQVIEEKRYEVSDGSSTLELVWMVEYDYDGSGNILSSHAYDPRYQSGESKNMTYDSHKHPFTNLAYYFTGESFVNNLLSKELNEEGLVYDYELRLNELGYPDIIYEKLGAVNTRIIRYSYREQ